jgi:hypothetical protein
MKQILRPGRTPSQLSQPIHQRLNMYVAAASAAGVSLLALTPQAGAKIVYTPAHKHIGQTQIVPLDLNHDGIADFNLSAVAHTTTSKVSLRLDVFGVGKRNDIWGTGTYASALAAGVLVGPNQQRLQPGHNFMAEWVGGCFSSSRGPWKQASRRYLGFRFFFKGKAHYGWARLNANFLDVLLTGYAYETIPNKPIVAGKTTGPEVVRLAPATLGHLAAGASAISSWRSCARAPGR